MNVNIHFKLNNVTSFTVLYNVMPVSKLLFHVNMVNVIKLNHT